MVSILASGAFATRHRATLFKEWRLPMRGGDVEYKCFVVVKTYDEHRILVIKVVRTAKTFLPTRSPGSPFGRTATLLRFRKTCTDHNVNGPVLVSVLWIQLRCSPSEEGGAIR